MKKTLRWILRGLLVLVAIGFAIWLLKDSILKSITERRLLEETGLTVKIGQMKVGLGSATVALRDIAALNPPGFGQANWLHVIEASGALDVRQVRTNQLHFREAKLDLGELSVVKNRAGALNLESVRDSILTHLQSRTKKKPAFSFGGIDRLELSIDQVNYIDEQQPTNSLQLDLGIKSEIVTNLQTEEDVTKWANAFVLRIALREYLKNPKLIGLKFLWEGTGKGE